MTDRPSIPSRPACTRSRRTSCATGAAAAIEFYKEAFGAVEVDRLAGPDGRLMHAMLRIGDSPLMLVDEFPEMQALGPKALGGSPVTIHLSVADADAAFERATAAGAAARMPVTDMFWGARYGLRAGSVRPPVVDGHAGAQPDDGSRSGAR